MKKNPIERLTMHYVLFRAFRSCFPYLLLALIGLATLSCPNMRTNVRGRKQHLMNAAAVFVSVFLICWYTLLDRTPTDESRIQLELFWSYRLFFHSSWEESIKLAMLNQIVQNYLLYLPFGYTLSLLSCHLTRKALVSLVLCDALLLSCSIEAIQYLLHIGLCELDDVFDNCIGAILGYLYFVVVERLFSSYKKRSAIDTAE